jgi:hypothetical protein
MGHFENDKLSQTAQLARGLLVRAGGGEQPADSSLGDLVSTLTSRFELHRRRSLLAVRAQSKQGMHHPTPGPLLHKLDEKSLLEFLLKEGDHEWRFLDNLRRYAFIFIMRNNQKQFFT